MGIWNYQYGWALTGLIWLGLSGYACADSVPLDLTFEPNSNLIAPSDPMSQLNSVTALSDVQPTDWAFSALQSLIERYGCLVGYPDGTFRGDRTLTRFEFAAALNACLDAILRESGGILTADDLATLEQLQTNFQTELETLRVRVDTLTARTFELEANQFSTTTTLSGVAILGVQGRNDNRNQGGTNSEINTAANYFFQASLSTQLSPRDLLLTGLWASNSLFKNSQDGVLGYELPLGNTLQVSDLSYRRLMSDNLAVIVGPIGVDMVRVFRGPNRVESAATGSLSVFGQRNPILNIGFGGGGIGFDWKIADFVSLQAVYSTPDLTRQGERGGLTNGNTTTGVQLLLTPAETVDVSLYYVNNYSPDGFLSFFAGDGQLTVFDIVAGDAKPLQTHAVGATLNWQISPRLSLGLWGGYTNSRIPGASGTVETTNYLAYLNFPDLFREGNLGGVYIGQPPKIISSDLPLGSNIPDFQETGLGRAGGRSDTTIHLEAFYRARLSNNVSITPGIIHIINPTHSADNDSITVGVLRTTFLF